VIDRVYPDPCDRSAGPVAIGPRTADLVDALRAQKGGAAIRPSASDPPTTSVPTTTMVNGFSGIRMQVQVPFEAAFATCTGGQYVAWSGATGLGATRYYQTPGQVDDLRILDVGGQTFTLQTSWFPDATPAERALLDDLIASVTIMAPAARSSDGPTQPPRPQPAGSSATGP
jgi:hypothetical protein